MKKFILFVVVFLASSSLALGVQLGPATPSADHGEVNLGVGYFYKEADWGAVDIKQNRAYLHLGYGLGLGDEPRWEAYIRGGAADLDADDLDGDYEPFANAGIKGAFWDGPVFGWGMVLQGGYFADFEDNNLKIEQVWEIELGIPVQARLGRAFLIYAGPVAYKAEADAQNGIGSTELEEDNNLGGFGGFRWSAGNVSFEAEAQYKSDLSAGGLISVQF